MNLRLNNCYGFQKNHKEFQRKLSLYYYDIRTQNFKYLIITIISQFLSIYFCSFSSVSGFCTSFLKRQKLRTCCSWCACMGKIRHAKFVQFHIQASTKTLTNYEAIHFFLTNQGALKFHENEGLHSLLQYKARQAERVDRNEWCQVRKVYSLFDFYLLIGRSLNHIPNQKQEHYIMLNLQKSYEFSRFFSLI